MSKFFRALLISAAATGVIAVILNALDLDAEDSSDVGGSSFANMDPDNMSEEDVDALMNELASQLKI
jgi:hypothetical protein